MVSRIVSLVFILIYKMHGVHVQGNHSLESSVGGLIHRDTKKVILTREARGDDKGKWGLPGGTINQGLTAYESLKKEIKEEIGIDSNQYFSEVTSEFPDYAVCGSCVYFFRFLNETPNVKFNDGEIDMATWIPISTLISGENAIVNSLRGEKLRPCFEKCLSNDVIKRAFVGEHASNFKIFIF